jgi:virginiamycin B lyase
MDIAGRDKRMEQSSQRPQAGRTGRTATDRVGARPDRAPRLLVEALESRQLLAVSIREFPIPTANSNPFWITPGASGSLYFTAGGTNQIGSYNPVTHAFSIFPISNATIGSNSFITNGTDGNLYFTAAADNAIEQLNPSSRVVTPFPIPTANLGPQYITTFPNGDLYFTASGANVIEQLDPSTRVFRTFFIPTANAGASGITAGPQGSLWFVESTANQLGQLNPTTGVFTTIPVSTTIGANSTITAGTNGDLYFTAPGSNSIVQFDPTSHVFRSFLIPAANSQPAAITNGPDGNLYFTEPGTNQIGQLNPTTFSIMQFLIPTANAGAAGIAPGSDGNVYFAETSANNIGEAVISTSPTPPTPPAAAKPKGVVVVRPKVQTTTIMTVAPNPATVGQVVTLTATVTIVEAGTPSGFVTFSIDGQAQPPLLLGQQSVGPGEATLSTKLGAGTHIITAAYQGNSVYYPSVSNAVSVAVAPAMGDGPTIANLARLGFHSRPTKLVLTFDQPLDATRAQEPSNYAIVRSNGRVIPIASVVYDPSTLTVTITPAKRLNIHKSYLLTVMGTAPNGLTNTSGVLLDGGLTGQPGSDYVATITAANLRR